MIRNAGGRASDDAIRSLVISHKLLGTKEWFVIHHTDCGMEYFKSNQLAELLTTSLSTAKIVPDAAAPKGVKFENVSSEGGASTDIDFLHIDDQDQSVQGGRGQDRTTPACGSWHSCARLRVRLQDRQDQSHCECCHSTVNLQYCPAAPGSSVLCGLQRGAEASYGGGQRHVGRCPHVVMWTLSKL